MGVEGVEHRVPTGRRAQPPPQRGRRAGHALLMAGCGGGDGGSSPPAALPPVGVDTGTPSFTRSVWLAGLQNPWDIAFALDGAALFSERSRGPSFRWTNNALRWPRWPSWSTKTGLPARA